MKNLINLLTLLAVVHSSIAFADETPQSFYNCMTETNGIENFDWTMSILKSVPQNATSQMTLEQIIAGAEVENDVKEILADATKKNLMRFANMATSKKVLQKDFNFQQQFAFAVRLFGRYVRMRLHTYKKATWSKPITFQILLSPKPSQILLDRQMTGLVPRLSKYPADRVVLFEPLVDRDSISSSYSETVGDQALAGLNLLSTKALTCGGTSPYFASAVLDVTINPVFDDSTFKAQLVVGMPMGSRIPFDLDAETAHFNQIIMPSKVDLSTKWGAQTSATDYPMAFVNIAGKFSSMQVPVLVRFGKIGNLLGGSWERAQSNISREDIPRMRGEAKALKTDNAIVTQAKKFVNVDVNFYNFDAVIDFTKAEASDMVQLTDVDLYLSLGLNALPDFKVAMINSVETDEFFESETNRTIKTQIQTQTEALRKQGIDLAGSKAKLSPEQAAQLVDYLFSSLKLRPAAAAN